MKNIIFHFLAFFLSAHLYGQVHNDGGVIFISNGGILHAETNVHNTNSGTITNNGTLTTTTDFENSDSGIAEGTGQYNIHGNWTNSSTFSANTSTVTFMDAGASNVTSGGNAFYDVEINKTAGNDVNILDDAEVTNSMSFTSDNNKVNIGTNNLTFGSTASVSGYDNSDYIVTGGTGEVVKNSLSNFTYPVGFDTVTYNPVTVTDAGTTDNIGVRVMENMLDGGASGAPLTDDVVNASWVVSESTAGGSNLTVAPEWTGTDELGIFDRTQSGVYRHDGTEWTLEGASLTAATGTNPYAQSRAVITSVGIFAVGGASLDIGVVVAIDLLLQGPYAGGGMMDDNLRSLPDFPTTEPYTALGFTHFGDGGAETINPAILTTIGNDAIADWVFVELRDATTFTTILGTRSALLQADGDVVDTDGVSDVFFSGIPAGSYYVAVKHRNHLGVMTPGALPLSRTPVPHDFSSGSAYGNLTGIVQKDLGGALFGLFEGDLDDSGTIDAADRSIAWNFRNQSGYLQADCSMNGICDASERSQVWNNRNKSSAIP